jgi:hypothetical protein
MYSALPLTLADTIARFPVLAAMPHQSRSDRYEHIPTSKVLAALRKEGFNIHGVEVANVRTPDRNGFQKHMIRLRRENFAKRVGDEFPEIVIVNSHDGTSAYKMSAGMVRLVCLNGLVVGGQQLKSVSVPHVGKATVDKVINGTFEVVDTFPAVMDRMQTMKAVTLHPAEQQVFAKAALSVRYPDDDLKVPLLNLLRPRRHDDTKADLWTTFNVVQEHLIRGGAQGIATNDQGRQRVARVREVKSVDGNIALNRALWQLADEMAKLKQAA